MDMMHPPTLQQGARGQEVTYLQKKLSKDGVSVTADGIFGPDTAEAVRRYQRSAGLVQDGIVGPKTWAAIQGKPLDHLLKEGDLEHAAQRLDVDLAAIKAVNEVESAGSGFLDNGKPAVLFERHIMYRHLCKRHSQEEVDTLAALNPTLVNSTPGGYAGGTAEHQRLARARLIDDHAALSATSWGLFQIMGLHWERLGFADVQEYAETMGASERAHLDAFVTFIITDHKLHHALREHKWAQFARIYNGPAYKQHLYDVRLARAYQRHQETTQ